MSKSDDERRSPAEKIRSILVVVDLLSEVAKQLLRVFGRRKEDQQR